jgi:hypothetical protein
MGDMRSTVISWGLDGSVPRGVMRCRRIPTNSQTRASARRRRYRHGAADCQDQRHAPSLGGSPRPDDRVSGCSIERSRALLSVSGRQGFPVSAALTHHARVLLLSSRQPRTPRPLRLPRRREPAAKREGQGESASPNGSKLKRCSSRSTETCFSSASSTRRADSRRARDGEGAGLADPLPVLGVPFDFGRRRRPPEGYFIAEVAAVSGRKRGFLHMQRALPEMAARRDFPGGFLRYRAG